MDKDFWGDIYQREDNGENGRLGVYAGIPCLITRAEERPWKLVNPTGIEENGLFLAYLAEGKPENRATEIPEAYTQKVESALRDLYLEKYNKIPGNAQAPAQAKQYINSCLKARDIQKIKEAFEHAGIGFMHEEMDTHYTEGSNTETLYFMKDGRQLSDKDIEKYYYAISPKVENWLDNNGFYFETPFGCSGINYDEQVPELNSGGAVGKGIKEIIDSGLKKPAGRYRVEVPFAQLFDNDEAGIIFSDVKFSPRKKIKIYCDLGRQAQEIADSYPAGSVKIIDQQKERA